MDRVLVRGSIPAIVRNDDGLYEGNLRHYFKVVFHQARNANNPYHNIRHMLHVLWLCYQACEYYKGRLSKRKMRNLLVAALFHDFDHTGKGGTDDKNITNAIAGFTEHMLEEDRPYGREIRRLIVATQFPYVVDVAEDDLLGQIIRDTDLSQALNPAWIQQVIFGLAAEWNKSPMEVLWMQEKFLANLKFRSEWARQTFPPNAIAEKIAEAKEFIELLS